MFIKTLVGVVAALGLAPVATAATPTPFTSPPPAHVRQMHWFHWNPMAHSAQLEEGRFGSRVVVGLESMRDLAPLRTRYRFRSVNAISQLRAAEVGVDRAQLRALLAAAPIDSRIRYVSPLGPSRRRAEHAERPAAEHDRSVERAAVRVAVRRLARRPGARVHAGEPLDRRRDDRHRPRRRPRPGRQDRRPLEHLPRRNADADSVGRKETTTPATAPRSPR